MKQLRMTTAAILLAAGPMFSGYSVACAAERPTVEHSVDLNAPDPDSTKTYDQLRADLTDVTKQALDMLTGDRGTQLHDELDGMMTVLRSIESMYVRESSGAIPQEQWRIHLVNMFTDGAMHAMEQDELGPVNVVPELMEMESLQAYLQDKDPQRYAADKAAIEKEMSAVSDAERQVSSPLKYLDPVLKYLGAAGYTGDREELAKAVRQYLDAQANATHH